MDKARRFDDRIRSGDRKDDDDAADGTRDKACDEDGERRELQGIALNERHDEVVLHKFVGDVEDRDDQRRARRDCAGNRGCGGIVKRKNPINGSTSSTAVRAAKASAFGACRKARTAKA